MNRKLSFMILDAPAQPKTHCIAELCEHLTVKVLESLFLREKTPWKRESMGFFSFDNQCQPLVPTGTVLFKSPPQSAAAANARNCLYPHSDC